MKVLDIYSKKDLDILTCNGVVVSKIMDDFFEGFPKSYRKNYDSNLKSLEIWRVDEHYDGLIAGEYHNRPNVLIMNNMNSFVHELLHISSYNMITNKVAFCKNSGGFFFEEALIEGMTEYLSASALNDTYKDYFFEAFVVSMLANIEGIFEPYFIPSYEKFMSLFPDKKDIVSLMYALSFYYDKNGIYISDLSMKLSDIERVGIKHSVCDVIDSLISIQLSMKMGKKEDTLYAEKFMDLLANDDIQDSVVAYCDDCLDYANEQINKRILRRIR